MKTHKELIIGLKEITLDNINSPSGLFNTYQSIYAYSKGMALAFKIAKKLTEEEYKEFYDWLIKATTIEEKIKENIGTFFKPKYKTKNRMTWKTWG